MQKFLPVLLLIAIAGCGGGAGGSQQSPSLIPPAGPASPPAQTASVQLKLVIPPPAPLSAGRHPSNVSPASNSLTFAQTGGPTTTVNIAPTSPNCTTAAGGQRTCSASVSANAGPNQTFSIKTFASTDGSGAPLSAAMVVQTIVSGQANTVAAVLNGVVASISVAGSPTSSFYGESGSMSIAVNALDASGNTIVGPGVYGDANGNPITIALTNADTTGSTKLSQTTVTQPGPPLTLAYNGGPLWTTTITGSSAGIAPGSATLQFVCRPTPGTAALYADGFDAAFNDAIVRYGLGVSGTDPPASGEVTQAGGSFRGLAVDSRGMVYSGVDLVSAPTQSTSVAAFCPDANGSPPPFRSFVPASQTRQFISFVAVGAQRNVFTQSDGLNVFGPDTGTVGYATANTAPTAPTRAISGSNTQMFSPSGLAVDPSDNAYVGTAAQILVFGPQATGNVAPNRTILRTAGGLLGLKSSTADSAGNVYGLYANDNRVEQSDLKNPYGTFAIAVFPAGSTRTPSRVITGPNTQLGTHLGNAYNLANVNVITVDPNGNIYVANSPIENLPSNMFTTHVAIGVFGPAANGNVAPTRTVDVDTVGTGQRVGSLAADAAGTVYLGDENGYGVLVFNSSGTFIRRIEVQATGIGLVPGLALDSTNRLVLESVRYKATDGNTYGTSAVFVFPPNADTTTAPVKTFTTTPPILNDTFSGGLALGSTGNVFLLNNGKDEVQEYASTATGSATPIRTFTDPIATGSDSQEGIALDGSGNIYVGGFQANTVFEYAPGSSGSVAPLQAYLDYGPSTLAASVAFDKQGALYAVSCPTNSVSVYPGGMGSGLPPRFILGPHTRLFCPGPVAVDSAGNVYVMAFFGDNVIVFGPGANGDATPIRSFAFTAAFYNDLAVGPGTAPVTGATFGRMPSGGQRRVAPRGSHVRSSRTAMCASRAGERAIVPRSVVLVPHGAVVGDDRCAR